MARSASPDEVRSGTTNLPSFVIRISTRGGKFTAFQSFTDFPRWCDNDRCLTRISDPLVLPNMMDAKGLMNVSPSASSVELRNPQAAIAAAMLTSASLLGSFSAATA